MNDKQIRTVVGSGLVAALVFVYPPWIARYAGSATGVELGHAWIWSPPGRVTPEQVWEDPVETDPAMDDEELRRLREHIAAGLDNPEVVWAEWAPRWVIALLLMGIGVFAHRSARRSRSADE